MSLTEDIQPEIIQPNDDEALQEDLRGQLEALASMEWPEDTTYKGIGPMLELYAGEINRMQGPLQQTMQTLKLLLDEPLVAEDLLKEGNSPERNFVHSTLNTLSRFEQTLIPFSVYLGFTATLLGKGHILRHKEFKAYVESAVQFLEEYLIILNKQHEIGQDLLQKINTENTYIYAPVHFLVEALQAHPGSHMRSAVSLKAKLQSVDGLITPTYIAPEPALKNEEKENEEAPVQLDPLLAALLNK